ncbi:hypothetical protein NQ315_006201 [Exocentrus adspersus]|uniref:Uncharacterized protein n=1 Tax=Exocentrus adspersus TaxID=1586481 RepID=A0AAV8VZE4_9CUCU|nr:hypothetical protein NQ315_006201 [Exocentrus adspersus]
MEFCFGLKTRTYIRVFPGPAQNAEVVYQKVYKENDLHTPYWFIRKSGTFRERVLISAAPCTNLLSPGNEAAYRTEEIGGLFLVRAECIPP